MLGGVVGWVLIYILFLISKQSDDSLETEETIIFFGFLVSFFLFYFLSFSSPPALKPTSGSLYKNKTFWLIKSSPSVLQSLQTFQTCHLLQSMLLSLSHTYDYFANIL